MRSLILLPFILLCFSFNASKIFAQNDTISRSCPLDFTVLRKLALSERFTSGDTSLKCQYTRQSIRLVLSEFLRVTNSFLPPLDSAESCWNSFQSVVNEFISNFDTRRKCEFQTSWISQGCMDITTRAQFESLIPRAVLQNVFSACNRSLVIRSACVTCLTSLSNVYATSLTGDYIGNISDCASTALIYGAAVANSYGPTDPGTARCLFSMTNTQNKSKDKRKQLIIIIVVVIFVVVLALALIYFIYLRRKRKKNSRKNLQSESTLASSGMDSIGGGSTTLIKFTLDEIKEATNNFSIQNLIGKGGYGNVYKGTLLDGTEVALKRFKNLSAAGNTGFTHEVEVIASVRHVNLMELKGYCSATTQLEGHQRIIVCELMKYGSLYDNLFGLMEEKLSWPVRQKIALGTATGLAYLHYGAQPAIIHRDIKASNILLDESFEPKVADFGLAKFTPEGMTHLSTRAAGTMGYVAPEYALYGQLTERSDVYSFGVVLLELLSGNKALMKVDDEDPKLLADWAWSLVKEGRTLDVIEENMEDLDSPEIMEKYVLVAVLCSHPQLYARPTMDQVVKMLDTDVVVPSIPDRAIPLTADIDYIEKSVSSSGDGDLFTISGYQLYTSRGGSKKTLN